MTRKREDGGELEIEDKPLRNISNPLQYAMESALIPITKDPEQMVLQEQEMVDDPLYIQEGENLENKESVEDSKEPMTKKRKRINFSDRMKQIALLCEWNLCTAVFKKMEWYLSHIGEHLSADTVHPVSEGYTCSWRDCDFACRSKAEMDRHVYFHAFHTKIKSVGLGISQECKIHCSLDQSGRNVIPEIPEPFQCMWEDCRTELASAQNFYWHVQTHLLCVDPVGEGESNKYFYCSWQGCSAKYARSARLREHVRSHTQEKLVGCSNCGGIYSSNTKFYDHCRRQIPIELQQFQCSHCSRKFPNERLLRDHVRHHINQYKCPQCDMTCAARSQLEAHIRYRHTNLRPHKCPQCNRGFKYMMDLTTHILIHSGEPAYACHVADCKFTCRAQTTLNRHVKSEHEGMKKNYLCHICDAKFTYGNLLTKHLTKVHSFHWPTGHVRFRYKQDEDKMYRLQTVRYESIELNQDMVNDQESQSVDSPAPASIASTPSSAHDDGSYAESHCDEDLYSQLNSKQTNPLRTYETQEIILPSEF